MSFKKVFFSYCYALFFLIVFIPSAVYVSDPYSLFHRPWFNKGKMYDNLRIQNYGLIKYEPFDALILGTSMLQNTSADEATKKLKDRYANLSFSGAGFYERFFVSNFAFRTKKIKSVILSLDYNFNKEKRIENSFYPELYSENFLSGKIKVYLTHKALLCALLRIKCGFIERNLDRPTTWNGLEPHVRHFGGFDNWLKYWDGQMKKTFKSLLETQIDYKEEYEKYQTIFDDELLPLFENNKETSFFVIIPPYSAFWWKKRESELEGMMRPYEYLIRKTKNYPNVRIYWFYDEDYVFDIANYKDLTHYHEFVNSLQLDAIQNGTHIINESNYKQKFAAFIKKVKAFDLEPYLEKIRTALAEHEAEEKNGK